MDGVAVRRRQFIKAPINGLAKLLERGVVAGIQYRIFGESPKPLNEIEIRRIGGQEKQFNMRGRRPIPHRLATLVRGVVEHYRNGHAQTLRRNLGQ